MRKLLIGVCAIALVLASTSKEYKYIQNSNQTIYTNPLIEKSIIIQENKENATIISNSGICWLYIESNTFLLTELFVISPNVKFIIYSPK